VLEFLFLLALAIVAFVVVGVLFKVLFALILLPLTILAWVFSGLFKLVAIPFHIAGWVLGALLIVPLLALVVGLGAPLLAVVAVGFAIMFVVCVIVWMSSLFLGC